MPGNVKMPAWIKIVEDTMWGEVVRVANTICNGYPRHWHEVRCQLPWSELFPPSWRMGLQEGARAPRGGVSITAHILEHTVRHSYSWGSWGMKWQRPSFYSPGCPGGKRFFEPCSWELHSDCLDPESMLPSGRGWRYISSVWTQPTRSGTAGQVLLWGEGQPRIRPAGGVRNRCYS